MDRIDSQKIFKKLRQVWAGFSTTRRCCFCMAQVGAKSDQIGSQLLAPACTETKLHSQPIGIQRWVISRWRCAGGIPLVGYCLSHSTCLTTLIACLHFAGPRFTRSARRNARSDPPPHRRWAPRAKFQIQVKDLSSPRCPASKA